MKKKLLLALIALTCAFCLVFNLAGCNPAANNQSGEQHETPGGQGSGSSDSEDTSDEQGGGQQGGNSGEHVHNYGELILEQPATCIAEGMQAHYYCEGCEKYFDSEKHETTLEQLKIDIDPNAHSYKFKYDQTEHWQACTGCGKEKDRGGHAVSDGVCPACGYVEKCTEGLEFEFNEEIVGYGVSMGTAADSHIFIPSFYNNLPVLYINEDAFYECESLTEITIGSSVIFILECAFQDCTNLKDITIPDSVTYIGHSAFRGCTSLERITVDKENKVYRSEGNCIIEKESKTLIVGCKTSKIPEGVTSIGYGAFYSYTNLKDITIPNSVTSINARAFYNCTSLTEITIPANVTFIGFDAFNGCTSLTEITIPDSVTSIGSYAFFNCESLEEITISESVISIGNDAFESCRSLKGVYINDIVAWCNIDFGDSSANPLYYAHNLYLKGQLVTNLNIPNGVTAIKYLAFAYCESLEEITIPDSVTSIGSEAFSDSTSLTEITIPNSVTSIGRETFLRCTSLKEITIPDSVISIGRSAFYDCRSLTEITIPDSVTSIGDYAFASCTSLTEITIGNGVTSIGSDAFYKCTSLERVIFENTEGWKVSENSYMSNSEDINVSDPEQNAENFKNENKYRQYYWKRG